MRLSYLIFLLLSITFSVALLPVLTSAAEERIPTSIDIHTTSAWGVERFAPNHGLLHLNARLLDQHGEFFSFGPWIFQLSGYAEGDHLIPGWLSPNLYIGPDEFPRTITVKVILLGTPSIYATLDVVVDPYAKNIRFESNEGALHGGAPGTISFSFAAPNIPDGLYPARLTNQLPRSLQQRPDGVTAEGFESEWCEQWGFTPSEGYVLIEDNAGSIVFAFDETVTGDYFTWTLPEDFPWHVPDDERRFLSLELWIYVDDLEFRESFILDVFNEAPGIYDSTETPVDPYAPLVLYMVWLDSNESIPANGAAAIIALAMNEVGYIMPNALLSWEMFGYAEGDALVIYPWGAVFYAGADKEEREVIIQAFAANQPYLYDAVNIVVTEMQADFVPAFGEFSEDFHLPVTIPGIPDGIYHAGLILSNCVTAANPLDYSDDIYWGTIQLAEIEFTDETGTIKLLAEDNLQAGTWVGWFFLHLPVNMQGYTVMEMVINY